MAYPDERAAYAAWIVSDPVPCICGALLTRTTWLGRRDLLDPDGEPEGVWVHQGDQSEVLFPTDHRAAPALLPLVDYASDDDIRGALRTALDDAGLTRAEIDAQAAAGRWSSNETRWMHFASHFAALAGIDGEP